MLRVEQKQYLTGHVSERLVRDLAAAARVRPVTAMRGLLGQEVPARLGAVLGVVLSGASQARIEAPRRRRRRRSRGLPR